jgi:glyoxylase I family protein
MLKAVAIDHIVLRGVDISRSTAFYTDVLGCKIERERPEMAMMQLRIGSSLIDLKEDFEANKLSSASHSCNLDHFCLRIADFDAVRVVSKLRAAGVDAGEIAVRYGASGEANSIYAWDPDGNKIELRA